MKTQSLLFRSLLFFCGLWMIAVCGTPAAARSAALNFNEMRQILRETLAGKASFRLEEFFPSAVFVVNSTLDTPDAVPGNNVCADSAGRCTLRAAIGEANATIATDTINFNIGAGTPIIAVGSGGFGRLPEITHPVIINGDTGGAVRIQLNGDSAGTASDTDGLLISAGDSIVRNLVIHSFAGNGIRLNTFGGNTIQGCYIGTEGIFDNYDFQENGLNGIFISDSPSNLIGGTSPAQRNLIAGNMLNGIRISGLDAFSNTIAGNFIGTDPSGFFIDGNNFNHQSGILIDSASFNTIGGSLPSSRNLISGNAADGITLANANFNVVQDNYIGTTADGEFGLRNLGNGILLRGSRVNTIRGNVISSNETYGVYFEGSGSAASSDNIVQGNFIGTDATGNSALGNGDSIYIDDFGGIFLGNGSRGNLIGGTTAADRNIISGNYGNGIKITGSLSTGNRIQGNYIGTNAAGSARLRNDKAGVFINAPDNRVGGTDAGAGNVISGNGSGLPSEGGLNSGVVIFSAAGNVVEGNYIGMNASGSAALVNVDHSVVLREAVNNTIGGTSAGARNLIVTNTIGGIFIDGAGARLNQVLGNYLGTNAGGDTALGHGAVIIRYGSGNIIGGTTAAARNILSGVGIWSGDDNLVVGNYIGLNAGGTGALGNGSGVVIGGSSSNNTIGGTTAAARNVISGSTQDGVQINDSSGNFVQGNYIGTDFTGTVALGNAQSGVILSGANNTIGGAAPGAGNVIAANQDGVTIVGGTNILVEGNFIGTNAAGTADLGNLQNGVDIIGGTFGGGNAVSGNLISGNDQNGVLLNMFSSPIIITRNLIGTDASGNLDLGNSLDGVRIENSRNVIGTTLAGSVGNIISGNDASGVVINGGFARFNQIVGNRIGTNSDGTAALPNAQTGVTISGGASGNSIGGSTSTPGVAPGNLISGQNGLGDVGIRISGTGTINNDVFGNLIGTDVTGTGIIPNGTGIYIESGAAQNLIGDVVPEARNIISGNTAAGVLITGIGPGATTSDNQIAGNYIGTDITGTSGLGNFSAGVQLSSWATNNIIGGTPLTARNVISANKPIPGFPFGGQGILITFNSNGNLVKANFIGMNSAGTSALPNTSDGIKIDNSSNNIVGGYLSTERNFISGNGGNGVFIDNTANNNSIWNNVIGLAADAATAMPNAADGIKIDKTDAASSVPVGNSVGGNSSGEPNIIAFNNGRGVSLVDASKTRVLSNSIFSNFALGIDLFPNDVTPNDTCDADTGANGLQNYPVIESAATSGGATIISGTLNSTASANFTIQIFVSDACDASGFGEGQTLVDSFSVVTDAVCLTSFVKTYAPAIPTGKYLTATATEESSGSTSEFSRCRLVTAPTAANVSIGGRVTTPDGQGIRNARLILTNNAGESRYAQTGSFGYFRFENVPIGETYVLTVYSNRFTFVNPSQIIALTDDLTEVNFTSEP